MRWPGMIVGGTGALAAAALAAPDTADRQRLIVAKHEAAAAQARADALTQAALRERDAAARSRTQAQAAAARVAAARADLVAARARVMLAADLVAAERERLAGAEAPVARLLAGLGALARKPAMEALARPGSIDDLVHLRAVLGATLPAVRIRSAGLRGELGHARQLRADRSTAAIAVAESGRRLDAEQAALAALAHRHEAQAASLGRNALAASDRAIALGEEARDIADQMTAEAGAAATLSDLAGLPGPPVPARGPDHDAPAYRLPVSGRLVTGFAEIDGAGVRSRGLTLAAPAEAPVVAPAGGQVIFARPFRHYRSVVVIDHGAGWTTLVIGLSRLVVSAGRSVRVGAPLGIAAGPVTVELRRRGRPIDPGPLL